MIKLKPSYKELQIRIQQLESELLHFKSSDLHRTSEKRDFSEYKHLIPDEYIESSLSILLISEADWKIINANSSFLKNWNFSKEDVIDISLDKLNIFENKLVWKKLREIFKKNGCVFEYEINLRTVSKNKVLGFVSFVYIKSNWNIPQLALIIDLNERKILAEKRKDREDKYSILFEKNSAVILAIDPTNGNILDVNPSAIQFYGYSREKILTMNISMINALSNDSLQAEMLASSAEQRNFFIFRHRLANGKIRDVEVYSTPFTIQDKPLLYCIIHDITDRIQAENQIIESERKYSYIVNTAIEGVLIGDKDRNITFVNKRLTEILGYPREELIGKFFDDLIYREDLNEHLEIIKVRNRAESGNYEQRFYKRDGSVIWLLVSSSPIIDNEKGIQGSVVLLSDISNLKSAELKLFLAKEKADENTRLLNQISNNLSMGMVYQVMVISEKERIFTYVSGSVKKFYGCTPEEVKQNPKLIYDKVYPEDIEILQKAEENALRHMSEFNAVVRLISPNGDIRWSSLHSSPRLVNGVIFWDGIETDITDIMKSEESLRRSEEKFQDIIEFQSIPIGITDGNQVLRFNHKFVETFGYTTEDVPNTDVWMNLAYPDKVYRDYVIDKWNKDIEDARKLHQYITPFEYFINCKNGTVKTIEISGCFIGNMLVTSFLDVTEKNNFQNELKKAKELAEENEARFKSYFLNSLDGIFVTDVNGNYLEVNPAACQITGYSLEELVKMNVSQLNNPNQKELVKSRLKMIQEKGGFSRESAFVRKNGSSGYWILNTVRLNDRFIGFVNDITERKNAEIILQKWALIFEHANWGISVDSGDSLIFELINPAFAKMHGFSVDELIGKPMISLLTPEAWVDFIKNIECANKLGHHFWESVHVRKNGNKFYVSIDVTSVKDEKGQFLYRIMNVQDITLRKNAENKIRENEQRLSSIYETVGDAIFQLAVENINQFRFESINAEFTKITGYERNFVIGRLVNEIIPEPNLSMTLHNYHIAIQENKLVRWEETTIYPGSKVTGEVSIAPLFDNDGQCISLVGSIHDITERKVAHELLLKSEEKFFKAFIACPEAMTISSILDGKYIEVNEVFCNISGYARDEVLGKTSSELNFWMKEEDRRIFMEELISKKYLRQHEARFRMRNGEIRVFLVSSEFVFLDNEECSLNFIMDITERKQFEMELVSAKEKAEESDRLKTAFLQNMSHEIRTPLNAIMGFSSMLKLNFENREKLEYFSEIIEGRGRDLLEIIGSILDISIIESGQLPVHVSKFKLNSLFDELESYYKEYQSRMNIRHIHFKIIKSCKNAEWKIVSDHGKLKQIFINLINNAFKFTEVGKIEIGCDRNDLNEIVFFVSDSGIGIPKEKFNDIFKRFTQVNQKGSRLYGGTGIGLPIVQGLLKLIGGKIWLESELGKGTTFYFSIPNLPGQTFEIEKHNKYQDLKKAEISAVLLVVEDDIYNMAYLKEIFADSNFSVIFTEFGKRAVEIALTQHIDLVLMDIRLPDISGYEAIQLIKREKPKLAIIVQTAYATSSDKQKAMDAGCSNYISKPINKSELLSKIEMAIL